MKRLINDQQGKVGIIVGILALLGIGFAAFQGFSGSEESTLSQASQSPSTAAVLGAKVSDQVEKVAGVAKLNPSFVSDLDFSSESEFATLGTNVTSITIIDPSKLKGQLEHFFSYLETIEKSQLVAKTQDTLGKQVKKSLEAQLQDSLPAAKNKTDLSNNFSVEDTRAQSMSTLSEFGKTILVTGDRGGSLPAIFLSSKFTSDKFPAQIKQQLAANQISRRSEEGSLTIKQDPNNPDIFVLDATFGKDKTPLDGQIQFKGNEILLLSPVDFKFDSESTDGKKLIDSNIFKEVSSSLRKNSFVSTWSGDENFKDNTLGWMKILAGEDSKEVEDILGETLKNLPKSFASSVTLDQGMVATTCSKLNEDSDLTKAQIKHLSQGQGSTSVAKLITAQTIFALGFSEASIALIEPTLKQAYGDDVVNEVWKDPNLQPVIKTLESVQGLMDDFELDEISLALGIPAGIPTVDTSILISHKKGDSTELLKKLNESINAFGAKSVKSNFTEGVLTLNTGGFPGIGVVGKVLKDGKILMAGSEISWPVVAKQLESEPSFLNNNMKIAGVNFGELNKSHQGMQYFSTKPLITMAQGFAGMAAGQLQGQGLTVNDLRDFVTNFDFRFASVTQAEVRGDHLVCQKDMMSLVE